MPGRKDYVSVSDENGKRIHIEKKLILSNLKELFNSFRLEHSDKKIGFSTFASMRPKHCVLAGVSGTHTICVCAIHQNVKLMIISIKSNSRNNYVTNRQFQLLKRKISGCTLKELSKNATQSITSYRDCLNMIVCPDSTEDCHLGKCANCPGIDYLNNVLTELLSKNEIDEVTYKQWLAKLRTSLETFVKDSSEFIDDFCEKVNILLPHAFISKKQVDFMKNVKMSLKEGDFLVICDFAENYAFVVQDAAPGFHWNNSQATVYPVVIYFKDSHKSLAIVSDNTIHDAIAVHIYTRIVVNYIKSISDNVRKIYYFSDGAPQQFKNYKNIANLCHHEKDFGIKAEWHFFATAHGKSPCDGIGGTLKREAARASLQRPSDRQITTPKELYNWANQPSILPNMAVEFSEEQFYHREKLNIEKRFENVKRIPHLQKIHYVIPERNGSVIVKDYSSSTIHKIYKILKL